jgi:hypothetical protein
MLALPAPLPAVASPRALTEATSGADEDHATIPLRLALVPSLKEAVALNRCWPPGETLAWDGVTEMETIEAVLAIWTALAVPAPTATWGTA